MHEPEVQSAREPDSGDLCISPKDLGSVERGGDGSAVSEAGPRISAVDDRSRASTSSDLQGAARVGREDWM